MENITGKWTFNEEFECGTDKGFAYLEQNGERVVGYLEYEECIEDESPFMVRQMVEGTIKGNKIYLKGVEVLSPEGEPLPNYNLDTLEGTYTHEKKIVGHSYDSEDICGVFVMSREE
ncbi:hypothetical protein [Tenuifilum thalassicum]|uniref:Lipocalin family protein n=1 Tax=Tenuifilum thalassicum TaxID=2590900 RepID=A0A7D4C1Z8_9BACT|nr:hypothetical protein [Tenuifilum thalassicum]QKG81064.1 hypothetical protein FHG85_12575 [Tenuifilum thalassicum]